MKRYLTTILAASVFLIGCATVDPGSRPIVVRTEQLEQSVNATSFTLLRIDNLDRGFWRTNAPAFHGFCDWLRTPTPYGTNTLPRHRVLVLSLDDVKLDYKRGAATSNQLYAALITLESIANETRAWLNIVTNKGVVKP